MDSVTLGAFDLEAEIARFQPGADASGRRAETLVKTDRLRLVLVTMRTGVTLDEHTAPGPITIQVLRGSFDVTAEGRTHALRAGGLVALASRVRHTVHAIEDGAFLLTIAWPPRNDADHMLPTATSAARDGQH